MAHKYCLVVPGDFPGTPKIAEMLALGGAGGCIPVFVSDAFAHLKAIAAEDAAKPLLDAAGVTRDEGVVDLDPDAFVKVAARRFHDRERAIW